MGRIDGHRALNVVMIVVVLKQQRYNLPEVIAICVFFPFMNTMMPPAPKANLIGILQYNLLSTHNQKQRPYFPKEVHDTNEIHGKLSLVLKSNRKLNGADSLGFRIRCLAIAPTF